MTKSQHENSTMTTNISTNITTPNTLIPSTPTLSTLTTSIIPTTTELVMLVNPLHIVIQKQKDHNTFGVLDLLYQADIDVIYYDLGLQVLNAETKKTTSTLEQATKKAFLEIINNNSDDFKDFQHI